METSKQLKADLALLFVAIGWGASFMLTKNALAHLETYNFLAIRFILAFAISAIIFWKQMRSMNKTTIKYGFILGTILFLAYALQTVGLNYTTASKSAFITGFSVVLVPILSTIMTRKRLDSIAYVSAGMAFVGLAFLTLNQSITSINLGDIMTFICAFATAYYIILTGKFAQLVEPIACAIIQIGIVAFFSLITTFAIETPKMTTSTIAWVSILTLSIVCTSGAFIIQMIAQKYTSAAHTALILTGEPVFAGIFGFIFLGEVLGVKGSIGAVLIFTGMIMSEVDLKKLFLNKGRSRK